MSGHQDGILKGIRVIELTTGIAGPVAAVQLAEAGAQVIKVEAPGGGPDRDRAGFRIWNRGKHSVALDLQDEAGRKDLHRLLSSADVFLHSLTPLEAERLGLGVSTLTAAYPGLIIAPITGWPSTHPDADRSGHEPLVLARLGLMDEQPGHRTGPVYIRMPFASFMAAWLSAIGILARLIHRARGGRGGLAETSIAQGALTAMTMHWARAHKPSPSFDKGLDKSVAIAIHQCSDGQWIHVHYSPDKAPLMAEAMAALGEAGVAAANARWGINHTAPNFGANKEILATRPAREWLQHFWEHDVAAQLAAPFGQIYFDQQAQANGYVMRAADAEFGETVQPGLAYHVSPSPPPGGAVPVLGQASVDHLLSGRAAQHENNGDGGRTGAPLQGLKIVDFGAYLAGPFAPMLLADLGAEVIKVEPPTGDAMRYIERAFCGAQRGKRSLALKLNDPRARPVIEALVNWADVAHSNIRMPAMRKLRIDYDALRAVNPKLIYCHVSSYGPKGPQAEWPGYDQMFQSSCGWEVENGGQGNPPMWLRFGITDHFGAVSSVFALLLAVYHRDRTGEGQSVSASLLGPTIWSTSEALVRSDGEVTGFDQLNASQTGLSNEQRIYRCLDGWIAVMAVEKYQQTEFCSMAGADPEAFFAQMTQGAALTGLTKAGVPAEVVRENYGTAFLSDEANRKSRLVTAYDHAAYGPMEQIGAFWQFGDLQLTLDRAPPTIGQHSREIFGEIGLPAALYEELEAAGVTVQTLAPGKLPAA